jgi:ElaB/YqjD/DUF883 family membrane-anchored ribosome-binding protein
MIMATNTRFEDSKAAAREIKEAIKEGATQVDSDLRKTAVDTSEAVSDTLITAKAAGPTIADGVQDKLDDVRAQAEDVFGDLYDDTVYYIRERPIASVLIAALGGAVLALLARRAVA